MELKFAKIISETPDEIKKQVNKSLDSLDKIQQISDELRKISFDGSDVVKAYFNKLKITSSELKELYKVYLKCDKSCLYGNKPEMIHQMIEAVCNLNNWCSIIYGRGNDSGWENLTSKQKYEYFEARDKMFSELKNSSFSQRKEYMVNTLINLGVYDDNIEKFVNYALQ